MGYGMYLLPPPRAELAATQQQSAGHRPRDVEIFRVEIASECACSVV
jgi:hypothetical protein